MDNAQVSGLDPGGAETDNTRVNTQWFGVRTMKETKEDDTVYVNKRRWVTIRSGGQGITEPEASSLLPP